MTDVRRFYIMNSEFTKLEEVSEETYLAVTGNDPNISEHAEKVWRGIETIDDVPIEFREQTQELVANKIERWGEYDNTPISSSEFMQMIKGEL